METARKTAVKKTAKKAQPRKAAKTVAKKSAGPRLKTAPDRIRRILDGLGRAYPGATCALHHRNAWELLVATILSAQCTDARVNMVTPALFKAFPTPKAMAAASLPQIEDLIRTTGFFRAKAKNIKACCAGLIEKHGGEVPRTMEELYALAGVGRKTANVVLGHALDINVGVVVDTHVQRLSNRLGLTKQRDPVKIEQDLMKVIPKDRWIQFSHEIIHHGRQICVARKPRCADCSLERECNSADKTWWSH